MTGHPDDQSFANTTSGNLFPAASRNLATGTYDTPITPVSQWLSLSAIVTPTAGAVQIPVFHYADIAGAVLLGQDNWRANAASTLVVRTPLRGPYVRVRLVVSSVANLVATTWANFQSAAADRIAFPVGYQNANAQNRTLAASGTDNYFLQRICAGLANWSFVPHDTTGKLQAFIQVVDELGAQQYTVSNRGGPTVTDNAQIEIPDDIIRVQVVNTDGAAPHAYDFSLTVPPQ